MNLRRIFFIVLGLYIIIGCSSPKNQNNSMPDKSVTLPYFGEIQIEPTMDYETIIEFDNEQFTADLNFYEDKVDKARIALTVKILNTLKDCKIRNETKLRSNFTEAGVVKDFVGHQISTSSYSGDFEMTQQIFDSIKLIRVGFYPDDDDHYVVFDYSTDTMKEDYRITIRYDIQENFNSIEFVS